MTVNVEYRSGEKEVMKRKFTALGRVLIIYLVAIAALFIVCTAMFGLKATLWGFAILYFGCLLGILPVWWQEERKWSRAACSKDPGASRLAHVASHAADPSGQPRPSLIP